MALTGVMSKTIPLLNQGRLRLLSVLNQTVVTFQKLPPNLVVYCTEARSVGWTDSAVINECQV